MFFFKGRSIPYPLPHRGCTSPWTRNGLYLRVKLVTDGSVGVNVVNTVRRRIALLHSGVRGHRAVDLNNYRVCANRLGKARITLLGSNVNGITTTLNTALLLRRYGPSIVVGANSTNNLTPALGINSVIISSRTHCRSTSIATFNCRCNRLPNYPTNFGTSSGLVTTTRTYVTRLGLGTMHNLVIDNSTFVGNSINLTGVHRGFPRTVTMRVRTATVTRIYRGFGIPFIIMHTVSSITSRRSRLDFSRFLTITTGRSDLVIRSLIRGLTRNWIAIRNTNHPIFSYTAITRHHTTHRRTFSHRR